MESKCQCVGYGLIKGEEVNKVKALCELVSGEAPRKLCIEEYILQSLNTSPATKVWLERNLESSGNGQECVWKLCFSNRMRSAIKVKGPVGTLKELVEVECAKADHMNDFAQDLGFGIKSKHFREGWSFRFVDETGHSIIPYQQNNPFTIDVRIVTFKLDSPSGAAEVPVLGNKWLVEVICKASGGHYADAVKHFEEVAQKLEQVVKINAVS